MSRVLITGANGQDGTLLTKYVKSRYPESMILGTTRSIDSISRANLCNEYYENDLLDEKSVIELIEETQPDIVFHFSGQSSVSKSFAHPEETLISNSLTTANLLKGISIINKEIAFFFSCSSDCFGSSLEPFDENTSFNPVSPYGSSKVAAYEIVNNYRKKGLEKITVGFLTNHESILRPETYVTRKIVKTANQIKAGKTDNLILGNVEIIRDWGYAGEYVEAIYGLMINEKYSDYVIGTGKSHSLRELASVIFKSLDLDLSEYLSIDSSYFRETDIIHSYSNPGKICRDIAWSAKVDIAELANILTNP